MRKGFLRKKKPAYWKFPKDQCDICRASLLNAPRYRVSIYIKICDKWVKFAQLVVCDNCFKQYVLAAKNNEKARGKVRVKYKKLHTLVYTL